MGKLKFGLACLVLLVGCKRDDLLLTQKRGLWCETSVTRYLYQNNLLADSLLNTSELACYQFKNNGRGKYTFGAIELPTQWSFSQADSSLNLCTNNGGLLSCKLHKVILLDETAQMWETRNEVDATNFEIVHTNLAWQK